MDSHTEPADGIHLDVRSVAVQHGGFHDSLDNDTEKLGGAGVKVEPSLLLTHEQVLAFGEVLQYLSHGSAICKGETLPYHPMCSHRNGTHASMRKK